MEAEGPVELRVFVEAGCELCQRALSLAGEVEQAYPELAVRVIDISRTAAGRDDVFAVPTFVLNGQVLSLGNPQRNRLREAIEALLRQRGLRVD